MQQENVSVLPAQLAPGDQISESGLIRTVIRVEPARYDSDFVLVQVEPLLSRSAYAPSLLALARNEPIETRRLQKLGVSR